MPGRRITIAGHPQRLGDLSHQALRAWLDHRRATWPHAPNRHILISEKTVLGDVPVTRGYLDFHLKPHGVSVERIRRDRILNEALTSRPDPLHLSLLFGISDRPASQYARIARDLLAELHGPEAGPRHDDLGGRPSKPKSGSGWLPQLSAGLVSLSAGVPAGCSSVNFGVRGACNRRRSRRDGVVGLSDRKFSRRGRTSVPPQRPHPPRHARAKPYAP